MGGLVFVRRSDGSLGELRRAEFEREVDLQQLLEDHPNLMGGDEMCAEEARRWLYVASEVGVPDAEEGGGRWGADLVFVDQDGVPAIIEVKRQGDTRLRREVVGQMLDYAAHAETYWQNGYLEERFVARCETADEDPDEVLTEFLGTGADLEQFWEQVHTNLRAGRITIVLASDDIPRETRRVIEFLHEQMSPTEVFGLEIGHFVGDVGAERLQALVPQIIGITETGQGRRGTTRTRRTWSTQEAQNAIRESCDDCVGDALDAIWNWAGEQGLALETGGGAGASIQVRLRHGDERIQMFNVYEVGRGQVPLGPRPAPFDSPELRRELARRLNDIDGCEIDDSNVEAGWPTFPLECLCDETARTSFLRVWQWFIDQYRRPNEDQEDDES